VSILYTKVEVTYIDGTSCTACTVPVGTVCIEGHDILLGLLFGVYNLYCSVPDPK